MGAALPGRWVRSIPRPHPTMPLICSFASHRSSPERIAGWIAHLERLSDSVADDPTFTESVGILLARARSWLADATEGREVALVGELESE